MFWYSIRTNKHDIGIGNCKDCANGRRDGYSPDREKTLTFRFKERRSDWFCLSGEGSVLVAQHFSILVFKLY